MGELFFYHDLHHKVLSFVPLERGFDDQRKDVDDVVLDLLFVLQFQHHAEVFEEGWVHLERGVVFLGGHE